MRACRERGRASTRRPHSWWVSIRCSYIGVSEACAAALDGRRARANIGANRASLQSISRRRPARLLLSGFIDIVHLAHVSPFTRDPAIAREMLCVRDDVRSITSQSTVISTCIGGSCVHTLQARERARHRDATDRDVGGACADWQRHRRRRSRLERPGDPGRDGRGVESGPDRKGPRRRHRRSGPLQHHRPAVRRVHRDVHRCRASARSSGRASSSRRPSPRT